VIDTALAPSQMGCPDHRLTAGRVSGPKAADVDAKESISGLRVTLRNSQHPPRETVMSVLEVMRLDLASSTSHGRSLDKLRRYKVVRLSVTRRCEGDGDGVRPIV